MALLDTTVYVDLHGRGGPRRKAEAQAVLRQVIAAGDSLVTSRINMAEIYCGVELSNNRAAELQAVKDYLTWITVLDLDDNAARHFAVIRAALQQIGRLAGDMDMLIASIALANGHAIVTPKHQALLSDAGPTGDRLLMPAPPGRHSTVTLLAKFRGLSTLQPRATAA